MVPTVEHGRLDSAREPGPRRRGLLDSAHAPHPATPYRDAPPQEKAISASPAFVHALPGPENGDEAWNGRSLTSSAAAPRRPTPR